jgi:hypothetical protein
MAWGYRFFFLNMAHSAKVGYTRFFCFIWLGFNSISVSAQYVYTACKLGYGPEVQGFSDSVLVVTGNESVSFERTRFCNMGMLYIYRDEHAAKKDTLPDSVVHSLHKILYPYFGRWTQTHLQILSLRLYNTYEPDREQIANDPYCTPVKFEYTCELMFNDYIPFPFLLQLDAKGNILNKQDIPHGIYAFKNMHLVSPCTIYNQAKIDPFFTGYLPWHSIELRYSNKVGVLYYMVESSGLFATDYYDYSKGGKQISTVKYMLYNAVTGKVIWKTTAKRSYEIGGDFTHESIEFKSNPFFNEP